MLYPPRQHDCFKQVLGLLLSFAILMSLCVVQQDSETQRAKLARTSAGRKVPENYVASSSLAKTGIASESDQTAAKQASEAYGKLPLQFEANHGQAESQVKFLSQGRGYHLLLTSTGATIALNKPAKHRSRKNLLGAKPFDDGETSDPRAVLRMKLEGANSEAQVAGLDELPGRTSYFIGNDPQKWRTNIPNYARVQYQEVYPGVDMVYYGNQRQLEYDFMVAPGANPDVIKLAYEGALKMRLDRRGDLVLGTSSGEVRQHKPVVYQEVNGDRKKVAGRYVIEGKREVGFEIGEYDTTKPLVIDPVLSYSTYLGGANQETGLDIAVDSAGNAYVTGRGFIPETLGEPIVFGSGGYFVVKLNPTGNALVYSARIGGMRNELGRSIAVDSAGNAYITGLTDSSDYPTTENAFQRTIGPSLGGVVGQGNDAFITKLNAGGSALLYSSYLGGHGGDAGYSIAPDNSGNAYVAGSTGLGFNLTNNFPTTANAFQPTAGSEVDAFVAKFNTNASGAPSLVYSTYLGGGDLEDYVSIALDSAGNAYVTGITQGDVRNFPTTPGAFQTTAPSRNGVFVTKLDATGSGLLYSTYLGGSGHQNVGLSITTDAGAVAGGSIAVDAAGNAYVTGHTSSTDFPLVNAFQTSKSSNDDAFVTKLNAAGSALIYSTYLGGSEGPNSGGRDEGVGIAVDSAGNAYVTGFTNSFDFPLKTPFRATPARFGTAFVTKLNTNASGADSLIYSSFLGGSNSGEIGTSIAVDNSGSAYVTGQTSSTDFPTVNPLQPTYGDRGDAFVTKISPDGTTVFFVSAIGPSKGGDTGAVTALIYGSGFTSGSAVKLTRAGQPDIVGQFVSVTGGGQIAATFDLREKVRGLWDVVVTQPGGLTATLPGAFTIEGPRQQPSTISITGRSNFRPGATGRINVVYTNNGNTDALLPITIRVPAGIGYGFPVPIVHRPLVPTPEPVDFSGLPMTFQTPDNPNTPGNEAETIIPLIVYAPAGSTGSIPMNLTHPNTNCSGVQVSASVGAPAKTDCLAAVVNLAADLLSEVVPGFECLKQAFELMSGLIVPTATGKPLSLSSFIGNLLLAAANCAVDVLPVGKAIKIAVLATEIVVGKGGILLDFATSCGPVFFPNAPGTTSTLQTNCVRSSDPNDKIGSSGVGMPRYLRGEAALPYVILFENKPEATAPAQEVVITDQLDMTKFDLTTFSLGPIAFGDKTIVPPPGLSEFNTDVDLRPANNLIVRLSAKLDSPTGLITWRFVSLDPVTMLPTDDPLAGFLPPNVNSPEGDGSVFFNLTPKLDLSTGTEIRNRARIFFDTNDPIDTPEWLNTIDKSKPQSQVLPLAPTQNSTGFEVNWGGTDLDSGVQSYQVFVSEDGGPFSAWLNGTTATSTFFFGKRGSAYSFYTVATDATGNREEVPAAADATTQIAPAAVNIIDDAGFFVRQHYADFLNREADASGLAFWTDQITSCGGDTACLELRRINVSAAFFLSIEFQQTGYLVYRMYKAAYGNIPNTPVPLRLNEFLPNTQKVGQGVVVGQTGWEQVLENNKNAFAVEFVARSRFAAAHPTTLTPEQFVDALFTNAAMTPPAAERTSIINEFGGAANSADTAARGRALRRVAENATLAQQEFNSAFVLMQYFGYLRRNPNDAPDTDFAGYNFWLTKLNQFNGNFVNAEMVKAFIVSIEYRQRFGQ